MKAVRVENGRPTLADVEAPTGDGVVVDIVSASICGSDLHLIAMGAVEGRVIGHEFAGTTPDGTAVAIEPTIGCGACAYCSDGSRFDCQTDGDLMGIGVDGGMAEQVIAHPSMLVPLPTGLDVGIAALVEPLAVAAHVVRRVTITPGERIAIVGAGPIGLATAAILRGHGVVPVLIARHDHQRSAGERLGARVVGDTGSESGDSDGFDVVIDAVGTSASIEECVRRLRPRGRVGLVGYPWQSTILPPAICSKEVSIIPAMAYNGVAPERDFDHAARALAERPDIADVLITHRLPLDAVTEGFAAAADRAGGTIKVLFDVSSRGR